MKIISLAVIMLLTACSSAPDINYYQLPPVVSQATAAQEQQRLLFVEPVQVATFLNGRGIVMQLSEVELVMARQHVWAEPLAQQLQRQVRDRILAHNPAYKAAARAEVATVQLRIAIDGFHGTGDGYATVSGHFAINAVNALQAFSFQVALQQDGYSSLVSALAEGVQQLSMQIAQQLPQ